eukprot:4188955-Amphidinium_carterae.2
MKSGNDKKRKTVAKMLTHRNRDGCKGLRKSERLLSGVHTIATITAPDYCEKRMPGHKMTKKVRRYIRVRLKRSHPTVDTCSSSCRQVVAKVFSVLKMGWQ